MMHYIVTIQRQFGSMGRPIAKKMAELLGISFYDRDIVEAAAKKLDIPVSVVREEEERAQSITPNPFVRMCFPLDDGTSDTQDDIFAAQKNVIRSIASQESCIIVGRCADFILSDMPDSCHIFIYAPYKVRVFNSVHSLGMSEKEARHMIHEVDKARRSYHMRYAGYAPSDPRFKDILIDSSFLGVDGTAEFLAEGIRKKFGV